MLCLTALTLCTMPAHAGHYSVSFSGGSSYDDFGNQNPDIDDGQGDYYTNNPNDPQGNPTGVYSASGTVTVTCTWQPDSTDDPPPQTAILDEWGYAYWEANSGTTTAGGSCDDGVGDPPIPNTQSLPYVTSGSWYEGDRYTTHPGGASFTFTRTPSITPGSDGGINGEIYYSVSVYSVLVNIVGDGGPSFKNYFLIGQYVGDSLDVGYVPTSPSDTYSWSISGGRPFDTFVASDGVGQYYPLWSTQSNTNPSVWSYFAYPDSPTITCQGTIDGQPVSATASIIIEPPNFSTDDLIGTTEAKVLPNPTYVQLIRDETGAHTGAAHGFDWNHTSVQIPPDYDEADNDPGEWNWTQLWTPNRKLTYSDGHTVDLASDTAGSLTGQEVLDTGYPYLHEWFYAEPGYGGDSDSPFSDLFSDSNGVPDPSYAELKVDENFRDFLMYKPPGGSSVAVPLQGVKWSWGFDAKVYGITNPDNSFSPTNWSVSDLKQHSDPTFDYPGFPNWSSYAAALQLYFPN